VTGAVQQLHRRPRERGDPYREVSRLARWQTPVTIVNAGGYGSLLSLGRRKINE